MSVLHANSYRNLLIFIQGDSGGKANVLGGDSIGRCKKNVRMEHVSDSEMELFESRNKKSIVSGVKKISNC